MRKVFLIISIAAMCSGIYAQNNSKVTFDGAAYGNLEYNWLSEDDTVNVDEISSGKARIDLGINVAPTENIVVHSTLRFQNHVGGYWGEGSSITLREITLKGVAGKYFKYKFGDINYKQTPYTFWNSDADLTNYEAVVFKDIRDIQNEENYFFDNSWRQQGAQLSSRLGFEKGLVSTIDITGFMFRNRSIADGITPDRLHGGGQAIFALPNKSHIGFNYVNLFDIPHSISNTSVEKYSNSVISADYKFDFGPAYLFGEAGISNLSYIDTNDIKTVELDGMFYDAGIGKKLFNNQLTINASYHRVEDDFISAGAQTKRIDFTKEPELLLNVTNNPSVEQRARTLGLIDLLKDENIYNSIITTQLMDYNPIFNPVNPYGAATPNRQGLDINIEFNNKDEKFSTQIDAQLLTEVRGEGTEELRQFTLINWNRKINIHKLINTQKTYSLTAAYQYATAKRDGLGKIPDVDITSNCIDFGAELEIFNRFDLLLGTKYLMFNGGDYKTSRDNFNQITDFTYIDYGKGTQNLNSAAFRYRFNDNIKLTLQGNFFDVKDSNNSDNNYSINQVFLMFNLLF